MVDVLPLSGPPVTTIEDSIVAVISENGLHSETTHNAQWGRIEIKILSMEPDFSEIESISLMSNGQTYRQTYLIHNEH